MNKSILIIATLTFLSFVSYGQADNLILNGNFQYGNNHFRTDYTHSPNDLYPEGTFAIGTNPQKFHGAFNPCYSKGQNKDHFMIINGSYEKGQFVWKQRVRVKKGKIYQFSGDFGRVCDGANALLSFHIDGAQIGTIYRTNKYIGQFETHSAYWQSDIDGYLELSIQNICLVAQGNDFGIDNLVFKEMPKSNIPKGAFKYNAIKGEVMASLLNLEKLSNTI